MPRGFPSGREPVTTSATLIGGPTVLLRHAGLTIITDPTFDEPGEIGGLVKTLGPAVPTTSLGAIDIALVSHHHHADNLDVSGRALLEHIPVVITTVAAAAALAGTGNTVVGLEPWESFTLPAPHGPLKITATPAMHGPPHVAPHTGPVIGFVVEGGGSLELYFSGDNSEVAVAEDIAARFPWIETAVLCVGAARVPNRGPDPLTLDAERASKVAALWPHARIVPVHADSWAHYDETRDQFVANWTGPVGQLALLEPGVDTRLV